MWLRTLAAVALLTAGCTELDVTNPNSPDRERVLSQPDDIESVIASGFRLYFPRVQENYPNLPLAGVAWNITGGFLDFAMFDLTMLPREPWNNSQFNTRSGTAENAWYDMYRVISTVNDGLDALNRGMELEPGGDGPRTHRARAFGRFIQGIAHGYLALNYDRGLVLTEAADLETLDPRAFQPYEQVRDSAIAMLEDGIRIAGQGAFTIPGSVDWINGMEVDNQELIRIMNSYIARLMVYSARSPEQRAAVDWNAVIQRIDAGITRDLAPMGQLAVIESNFRRLLSRVRANPSDHVRPSYMLLGPADVSGGWQNWLSTPLANRLPFTITTPDRRVHGAEGVNDPGRYFGRHQSSIWTADRGTWRWSWYFYHRSGPGESWYTGPQPTMTVDEMNLLKAEALIRLNRAAEALPLINRTRTQHGELPAVTVEGPPQDADCVPRRMNGACGSLWDALVYEKNIEMTGIEGAVAWYDARGWGHLVEGSVEHMPVPGRELDNLGVLLYTFGGSGAGSAPPPRYEQCPVSLPRC